MLARRIDDREYNGVYLTGLSVGVSVGTLDDGDVVGNNVGVRLC